MKLSNIHCQFKDKNLQAQIALSGFYSLKNCFPHFIQEHGDMIAYRPEIYGNIRNQYLSGNCIFFFRQDHVIARNILTIYRRPKSRFKLLLIFWPYLTEFLFVMGRAFKENKKLLWKQNNMLSDIFFPLGVKCINTANKWVQFWYISTNSFLK